ncbi:hypothetical protein MTO96_042325 [Rhipicephalus appendiculatus]
MAASKALFLPFWAVTVIILSQLTSCYYCGGECYNYKNGTMSGCKSACRCITDNFRSNINVGRGHCRNRTG